MALRPGGGFEWSEMTTKTPSKAKAVVHLTPEERAANGKAARADVPRSAHGEWEPASDRRDVVELLEEQAASRVPDLVPVRYGRMLVSPFTFFRGAAYPMAADLAGSPRTGLQVQLCGDAHLSNFGAYAAPDRTLVFSVNDFDETLPGPVRVGPEASGGQLRGRGPGPRLPGKSTAGDQLRRGPLLPRGDEELRRDGQSRALVLAHPRRRLLRPARSSRSPKQVKRFEHNVAKARSKDSLKAFTKLTELVDGQPRIVSDPPLILPIEEILPPDEHHKLDDFVRGIVRSYRRTLTSDCQRLLERFHYVHAARKVVGVGSVGTRAWIMLMVGRDQSDPLFLQFKEAEESVLEPFLGRSAHSNHGQRVVHGQRLMQAASDIMLGWIRATDPGGKSRDFYIRQLWDQKGSAIVEAMDPILMKVYAEVCGQTLAKAHARSGDAIAIASYLGRGDRFDRALASFAELYADQNERDYLAVREAVDSGRLVAEVQG